MAFNVDLENSKKLPLHELSFPVKENGVKHTVPALSEYWATYRPHAKYFPLLPSRVKNETEVFIAQWLAEADTFNREIEWMLELEHHRFWSYMVFDVECISTIVSFLQEGTPAYMPIHTITQDQHVITTYAQILQNVLAILARLVTSKESETEWITKEEQAKLIYDKFLITVPMLFDIIVIYGEANSTTVRRLIETLVKIQPKYQNDLIEALKHFQTTFNKVQDEINENDAAKFEDVVLYILDCAYTMRMLVSTMPPYVFDICLEMKLQQWVTRFYDNAVPMLYKNLALIDANSPTLHRLNCARIEFIEYFYVLINKFVQETLQDQNLEPAEVVIGLLQEALSEHSFIVDYQRLHPVENDIEILKQACPDLDPFKVNFIIEAYTAENENFLKTFIDQQMESTDQEGATALPIQDAVGDGATCSTSLTTEEKEIQNVLDVLPHLQRSFVQKLLARYESTELAIAAVLEGNIPPDLDETINETIEKEEQLKQGDIENATKAMDAVNLGADNDSQLVSVYNKVQKVRSKAEKRFLDDKSHIRDLQKRYEEYGYISEDYDDEYDDSYEAMLENESKAMTNVLKKTGAINFVADDVESESDTSEEEQEGAQQGEGRDTRKDFCENPELVRERWARNRQAKFGNRQPPKSGNVVGAPKGQGQDKNTQVSRHKKDVNKSSRANHNRRQGAAFKRNRGMIPS